jgi:hypothetical protein
MKPLALTALPGHFEVLQITSEQPSEQTGILYPPLAP